MDGIVRRTFVVSAVNLRKGGTLTILRNTLRHLSGRSDLRVYALVHDKSLCDFPGIEYIEFPNTSKSWVRRLWCEYVTMHKVSEDLSPVWMWLSLHDTTPRVVAEHQEVYCQTSFPFLKWTLRDLLMDPKVPIFATFTRWAYRINVRRNDCLIVQQEWFRDALAAELKLPADKFKVIPPTFETEEIEPAPVSYDVPMFFYASTPDCHKNFETICEAARKLEDTVGKGRFKVVVTVNGDENRYARWLKRRWGDVTSIDFAGHMSKSVLYGHYAAATAFIFPSRIETWGLPISEYIGIGGGAMFLADEPYAHETAAGFPSARYFETCNADALKELMYESIAAR